MFLNYTPVALTFGTSGLRGLVKDITDLEAYINVKGALSYFSIIGDIRSPGVVVLAGDLRPSTDRIMRACAQAIVDAGHKVENAGKIPTPALVAYSMGAGRAGVMVSGSHIPFDRNGIKLNKTTGEVLKSDEPGIAREVERIRAEEYARREEESLFDASGMLKRAPGLPPVNPSAEEAYVRRYVKSFAAGGLAGRRVLVYQHSAVGRDILLRILRELGADAVAAGRSDTFVPIDTENISAEQLDRLDALVTAAEEDGRPVDAVVSTDGDSDRPLMTAVFARDAARPAVRRVHFLSGDLLGIIVAEYLRADAVAVPISANDAVERRMFERGVSVEKTKIGSPFVIAALEQLCRRGGHSRICGWEANGGFLTATDALLPAGNLPALPTRDSTLPILANLFAAAERRSDLAALWEQLPERYGSAGLLDNVPVAVSQAILAHLVPSGTEFEVEFADSGNVLDRSRSEGPAMPLDGDRAAQWQARRAELTRFFTPALGFDDIARINVLDGVRVYFRNGDVAHVRPSGNAPQLRIYANSNSQARADEIVDLALREPDGILRRLERVVS